MANQKESNVICDTYKSLTNVWYIIKVLSNMWQKIKFPYLVALARSFTGRVPFKPNPIPQKSPRFARFLAPSYTKSLL
jgi:hypothetical protein